MRRVIVLIVLLICIIGLCCNSSAEQASSACDRFSESYLYEFVVAITSDGTVKAAGKNDYGQCNVDKWENVIKVATGINHTVGLCSDGSVRATGANEFGQCNTEEWEDIVDITAYVNYTIGLKQDGTLVYAGEIDSDTRQVLSQWTDVSAIFSSEDIHATCTNGDVVSTLLPQPLHFPQQVKQILSIDDTVYILTENGSVVCMLLDEDTWFMLKETNVVQIVDSALILLLIDDGTVSSPFVYQDDWTDIVAITANFGVKSDGTIVSAFDDELGKEVCKWKVKMN